MKFVLIFVVKAAFYCFAVFIDVYFLGLHKKWSLFVPGIIISQWCFWLRWSRNRRTLMSLVYSALVLIQLTLDTLQIVDIELLVFVKSLSKI